MSTYEQVTGWRAKLTQSWTLADRRDKFPFIVRGRSFSLACLFEICIAPGAAHTQSRKRMNPNGAQGRP